MELVPTEEFPPDDLPWPFDWPGLFPEAPGDAPEVPGLAGEPDEDPAEVDEEAAVVVVAPVVVAEPLPGGEAAGTEVVPVGAVAPMPRVLGALIAVKFAEEDGPGLEEEAGPRAALVGGAPRAAAPGRDLGWVAPARGFLMLDTSA